MSFFRAIVKQKGPIKVLEFFSTDTPANYWTVFSTEVHPDNLSVGDEVSVEILNSQVYLRGKAGGVLSAGGTEVHSDHVTPTTNIAGLTATGEMRSMFLKWNAISGGVGHGYYQYQVTTQADSGYAAKSRDQTTTNTAVFVMPLTGGTYRARVRPFGTDGVAGQWSEVQNIAVRDIISADINAKAITTALINDNAVDTLQMKDNAVTGPKIVAGSVTATKIASRVITTQHMIVGSFDNLVTDPGFENGTAVEGVAESAAGGTWAYNTAVQRTGLYCLRYNTTGQTTSAFYWPMGRGIDGEKLYVNCSEGEEFYAEVYARGSSGSNRVQSFLEFRDSVGTFISRVYSADLYTTTTYNKIGLSAIAPAGSSRVVMGFRSIPVTSGGATYSYFDDLYMRKRVEGNLIVDGTIDTIHLAANSITANQLAVNSVTALAIQAGAITANELAANSVTSSKIVAGAITAATIASGAITSTKLAANSVTANAIQAGAINGTTISGNTISSARFSTTNFSLTSGVSIVDNGIGMGSSSSIGWAGTSGSSDISIRATGDSISIVGRGAFGGGQVNVDSDSFRYNNSAVLTASSHNHSTSVSGTTGPATISSTGTSTPYTTYDSNDLFTGNGPGNVTHDHRMANHRHQVTSHSHGMAHTHSFSDNL